MFRLASSAVAVSGDLAAASSAITAACWPSGEVSGVGADVLAAFENASEALVAGSAAFALGGTGPRSAEAGGTVVASIWAGLIRESSDDV